ncbi:hypothetical protein ACFLS8_00385 [Chloroflexota bacterium]
MEQHIWVNLKFCLRCGCTTYIDRDQYGWYEECLQCSYLHDLNTIYEVAGPPRLDTRYPADKPAVRVKTRSAPRTR